MSPVPPPVPVEGLLARNLRARRAAANLSQAQISARMQALGFTSWQRSTMSLVEQDKRKLTAAELVGLALALGVKPERLIWPESGEEIVSLGPFKFRGLRLVMDDGSVTWHEDEPSSGPSNARELSTDAARQLRGALGVGEGEHFSATFRPGDQ